jgi:hypothetical protein
VLDDATCDRLIAHPRQDVAHASLIALRLSDEMKPLKVLEAYAVSTRSP